MAEALLFIAQGFEEIEGLTVVDLLRRASIEVVTVSIDGQLMVTGAHGITVKADCLFEEADFNGADMLILPGGMPGTRNLQAHSGLCNKIRVFEEAGKFLSAICAAPVVLGANGALEGKKATCYPGFEDELNCAEVLGDPVVWDRNVITSRGLGTAIEFALAIIERLRNREEAVKAAESIIYPI